MKTIEVTINLDPVHDGAKIRNKTEAERKKGAIVVGTNGNRKIISEKEAIAIMEKMIDDIQGEYLDKFHILAVMNGQKIFEMRDHKYFIGSVLIIKYTDEGLDGLDSEEFERALSEFESRLVMLRIAGQEYSAFEIS